MMKKIKPFCNLSDQSHYLSGFCVSLPFAENRCYLTVGDNSTISASFIFESSEGEITVGDGCFIGQSQIISRDRVDIGNDVTIAWNCLIYDHNSHSVVWEERKEDNYRVYQNIKKGIDPIADKDWSKVKSAPIKICDKVWIGTGCTILKGVTIGEGAVVGAGSVVTKDVEPWTVVGGNPAKIIRRLGENG